MLSVKIILSSCYMTVRASPPSLAKTLLVPVHVCVQIRSHCAAFREGLADVISLDWLLMFDHNELQVLISGAQIPIDLDDLKQHTNYSGTRLVWWAPARVCVQEIIGSARKQGLVVYCN